MVIPVLQYATVAQLVEQRIRNAQAVGSSPTSSSRLSLDAICVWAQFLFWFLFASRADIFLSTQPKPTEKSRGLFCIPTTGAAITHWLGSQSFGTAYSSYRQDTRDSRKNHSPGVLFCEIHRFLLKFCISTHIKCCIFLVIFPLKQ